VTGCVLWRFLYSKVKVNLHVHIVAYGDVRKQCRVLENGQTPTIIITPLNLAHEGWLWTQHKWKTWFQASWFTIYNSSASLELSVTSVHEWMQMQKSPISNVAEILPLWCRNEMFGAMRSRPQFKWGSHNKLTTGHRLQLPFCNLGITLCDWYAWHLMPKGYTHSKIRQIHQHVQGLWWNMILQSRMVK
jgi:hypothetical protein